MEYKVIKALFLFLGLLWLSGCGRHLTESGKTIRVIPSSSYDLLKECERLERVVGEAGSFLHNGEYGVVYATYDARNKAALVPRADTLAIIDDGPKVFGGVVTGVAYNCNSPRPSIHPPASSAGVASRSVVPAGGVSDVVLEKARRCQEIGGVWVNDTCVLPLN